MEQGYKDLACAVIEQAITDARMRVLTISEKVDKASARQFLYGRKGSSVDFWCEIAGIDRKAMQENLRL